MEKIKITFLGTSYSIPTKTRNHSSILLSYKDENILIDCGEGTQRQFRKANLNPGSITRLLITHWHGDHILGIPGLLQTLAINNYNKTLHIYGPRNTKKFISRILKMFVFEGKIKYKIQEVSSTFLKTPDFDLLAFPLNHKTPCNGYSFIEKDKLRIDKNKLKKLKLPHSPLLKKLTQGKDITINNKKIKAKSITYLQKGRKISFAFDTGYSKNIINNVKSSNLLICDSTYTEKNKDKALKHHHLTSKQAAQIAKASSSKKLILTHISQRYTNPKHIQDEATNVFKNTTIANDLDVIEI